tara:strand:- start:423 stop:974 length:552 start_codon:yes stop_codon:yes gene_type:complete
MSSTPTTDNQNAVNNTQDKCHRQDCKHGDQQENQREQCSLNESKPSSVLATTHVSQEQGRKTVDGVGESVEVAHQLQKEQVDTHDISKGHPVSAPVHAEDASCPVCYVNLISGHRGVKLSIRALDLFFLYRFRANYSVCWQLFRRNVDTHSGTLLRHQMSFVCLEMLLFPLGYINESAKGASR